MNQTSETPQQKNDVNSSTQGGLLDALVAFFDGLILQESSSQIDEIEFRLKMRVFIGTNLLLIATFTILGFATAAMHGLSEPYAWLHLPGVILPAATLFLARITKTFTLVMKAELGLLLLAMYAYFAVSGGALSTTRQWLPLLMFVAAFLIDLRFAGMLAAVVLTLDIGMAFYYASQLHAASEFLGHPMLASFVADSIGSMTFALALAWVQDRVRRRFALVIGRQEKDLVDRQKQLIQSAKMRALGEMASGIAHEINNPLSIIKTRASILRHKSRDGVLKTEELVEGLTHVDQVVDRIAAIVRGLRFFGREEGRDSRRSVSLRQLIDDTMSLCVERFKAHNVKLLVSMANGETPLFCNAVQISQVLLNLLNNAFDSSVRSAAGPEVTIDAKLEGDIVHVSVSDNGRGVPPEVVSRLFEPFFTTKPVGEGTGLGLSVSAGLVKQHGGQLYLASGAGKVGATFILELPLDLRKTPLRFAAAS